MEQYYYNHMDKQKQAAYHAMLQESADWRMNFRFRHWMQMLYMMYFSAEAGSSGDFLGNRIQVPLLQRLTEYHLYPGISLRKSKIKEHQKAMTARVDKLVRPAKTCPNGKRKNMSTILSAKTSATINSRNHILTRS